MPVLAVTAFAFASDEQKVMQNGFGYMPKADQCETVERADTGHVAVPDDADLKFPYRFPHPASVRFRCFRSGTGTRQNDQLSPLPPVTLLEQQHCRGDKQGCAGGDLEE